MQRKNKRVIIREAKERVVQQFRKNFMKPERNKEEFDDHTLGLPCKMNTKDKNLWITGKREKLETFIYNAIGNDWIHVYNKDNTQYWDEYYGQPFIVFRLYDKKNRNTVIEQIRTAGDWDKRILGIRHSNGRILNPDLFHCIVLSIYTPQEYTKGTCWEKIYANGIDWRYDELKI